MSPKCCVAGAWSPCWYLCSVRIIVNFVEGHQTWKRAWLLLEGRHLVLRGRKWLLDCVLLLLHLDLLLSTCPPDFKKNSEPGVVWHPKSPVSGKGNKYIQRLKHFYKPSSRQVLVKPTQQVQRPPKKCLATKGSNERERHASQQGFLLFLLLA